MVVVELGKVLGIVVGMVLGNFPISYNLDGSTNHHCKCSRTDRSCALVPLVEHYSWKLLS